MNRKLLFLILFIVGCAIGAFIVLYCTWCVVFFTSQRDIPHFDYPTYDLDKRVDAKHYYELVTPEGKYKFNLVSPAAAPKDIHAKVMLGYRIMCETRRYAKEFAGNRLNCVNCHFLGGNNLGGRNGSISLVGASSWYPSYNERSKKVINLADRLTNCFMRSMNGKAPPADSQVMDALLTYIGWISKDVTDIKDPPWRGLKVLNSHKMPDVAKGALIYQQKCATCHGYNGEGLSKNHDTLEIPPLWGPNSYNDGAGMNRLDLLSSFVHYNMPFENPTLSEEESIDVAGFVIRQKRPHFIPGKQP